MRAKVPFTFGFVRALIPSHLIFRPAARTIVFMKLKVIVHEAKEGGYWAEVPAIPGCATQGESFEELLKNLYEAIEGCLEVEIKKPKKLSRDRILEIAV